MGNRRWNNQFQMMPAPDSYLLSGLLLLPQPRRLFGHLLAVLGLPLGLLALSCLRLGSGLPPAACEEGKQSRTAQPLMHLLHPLGGSSLLGPPLSLKEGSALLTQLRSLNPAFLLTSLQSADVKPLRVCPVSAHANGCENRQCDDQATDVALLIEQHQGYILSLATM